LPVVEKFIPFPVPIHPRYFPDSHVPFPRDNIPAQVRNPRNGSRVASKDLAIRSTGAAWPREERNPGLRPGLRLKIFLRLSQKTLQSVSRRRRLTPGRAHGGLLARRAPQNPFEAVSKDIRRLRRQNKIMNEGHFG
jgi:hypothetical protein